MEIFFVLLLLAGGFWFYRWRARVRNDALRYLTVTGYTDNGRLRRWRYDFVEMFAWTPVSVKPRTEFDVRRESSAVWQTRLTQQSAANEAERLRKQLESLPSRDDFRERLRSIEQGPQWETLDGSVAGMLESHYQRFVHQYRG